MVYAGHPAAVRLAMQPGLERVRHQTAFAARSWPNGPMSHPGSTASLQVKPEPKSINLRRQVHYRRMQTRGAGPGWVPETASRLYRDFVDRR